MRRTEGRSGRRESKGDIEPACRPLTLVHAALARPPEIGPPDPIIGVRSARLPHVAAHPITGDLLRPLRRLVDRPQCR
jgi:hypothetical protein